MSDAKRPDADVQTPPASGTEPLSPILASFDEIPLPLEEPVPERVGGYRIVQVLGRGGMGTVYEAEQETTRRLIALKLIHPYLATPRYRRRFAKEIRALAKFEHAGIARIHDAGAAPDERGDTRLYCAMELVDGVRVDKHVARLQLAPRRIAELMALICDAVHHAHLKGVIHCDLKPANILVASDGTPKVLDFGIARLLDDEIGAGTQSEPTAHPGIVGTIAYASPEQTSGDPSALDALTDVYGLGAVLYTIVARRPPHDVSACSLALALERVKEHPPERLRNVAPSCPADLATIVAKAMDPTPSRRYASAAALADDLRRFGEGRPIAARPTAWHEAAGMWVRRNRALAAALGLVAIALAGLVTSVLVGASRVNRALERVRAERDAHEESRTALQGSSLPFTGRFRVSNNFLVHLDESEAPDAPGRVLRAFALAEDGQSIAGRSNGRLLLLNAAGDVVRELDRPREVPPWAHPRLDASHRFEALSRAPAKVITQCAVIGDLNDDGTRELFRGFRLPNDAIHMSAVEWDGIDAVVAADRTGAQLWSAGDIQDLRLDPSHGVLWCVANSEEISMYVPELVAWEGARCPGGVVVPTLAMGIPLDGLAGVVPPLAGDAEHRPVQPTFAWTTRPPQAVRASAVGGGPTTLAATAGDSADAGAPNTWLRMQAFVPHPREEHRGLGTLYVAFADRSSPMSVIASVTMGDDGRPIGPFRLAPSLDAAADAAATALIAHFDPAEEILSLRDLGSLADACSRAEQRFRAGTAPDRADEPCVQCMLAMQRSWIWLSNTASEMSGDASILRRVGDDREPERDASISCTMLRQAIEIHDQRMAGQPGAPCVHSRYLHSALALADALAQDWDACHRDATKALSLRDKGKEDHHDLLAAALAAIASTKLGLTADASASLALAESIASQPAKADGNAYWKAPIVLERARSIVHAVRLGP